MRDWERVEGRELEEEREEMEEKKKEALMEVEKVSESQLRTE